MKRIIIGISGASGVNLGLKFLSSLPLELEKYCVLSHNASKVLELEMRQPKPKPIPNTHFLDDADIGACIASGSFICEAMAVIPCSGNTLAKIACGIADTLITRSASVMIKEQRKLLLAPRETPLSSIALENMLKLSRLGIFIAPPMMGYYANKESTEEMECFMIGKWFDCLGLPYDYHRWGEDLTK